MKKVTTTATNRLEKLQRLTIGLDLGDRSSHYCVLDESGRVLTESKTATSPNAMEAVFGAIPRSRIALERHLSRKLCLEESRRSLEAGLEHGVELGQSCRERTAGAAPALLF
jgi:hypothetical protein